MTASRLSQPPFTPPASGSCDKHVRKAHPSSCNLIKSLWKARRGLCQYHSPWCYTRARKPCATKSSLLVLEVFPYAQNSCCFKAMHKE
jgi:hypothetical protein